LQDIYGDQRISLVRGIPAVQNYIDLEESGIERAMSLLEKQEIDPHTTFSAKLNSMKLEAGKLPGDKDKKVYAALALLESDDNPLFYIPKNLGAIVGIHIESKQFNDELRGLVISDLQLRTNHGEMIYNAFSNTENKVYYYNFQEQAQAQAPLFLARPANGGWTSLSVMWWDQPAYFEHPEDHLFISLETQHESSDIFEELKNRVDGSRIDTCVYFIVLDN